MRISIILTKKILLHRDKDANLNVNKMVKSREFQHLRNFLQETSLSESLSLFLCIFCDPFLPRIKAIATNTASSCRPNTVLQPLFGFPTNQNHFRTIFLVQITETRRTGRTLCVYINIYIYKYVCKYLHPRAGVLFWPFLEKAPFGNQRHFFRLEAFFVFC